MAGQSHARQRGAHPADHQLFGEMQVRGLRTATDDLCWLLTRGYSETAALKLVGDRYALRARQRQAVLRCSCSSQQLQARNEHRVTSAELAGRRLVLDGFNVLIVLESALSGGVLLVGRDGCYRDLASVHGSYHTVRQTEEVLMHLGEYLAGRGVTDVVWCLDAPVSNSGRLRARLLETAKRQRWLWEVELHANPDRLLAETTLAVVASSDGWILDRCTGWTDLVGPIVQPRRSQAWIVDLSRTAT